MSDDIFLDDLDNEGDNIQTSGDRLGKGFQPFDSGTYDFVIDLAYLSESKGGAKALNLVLSTNDNRKLNQQIWISSGRAKGKKVYYIDSRTKEKKYLPGFEMANDLCLLAGRVPLISEKKGGKKVTLVKQTHMLYDYEAKQEQPTEVPVLKELIGKEIIGGVVKVIQDKKTKNDAGEYVPTGKTRIVNEIRKFFRKKDGLTVLEARAKAKEAAFMQKWSETWTGEVVDETSGDTGSSGMPESTNSNDDSTEQDDLF